MTNRWQVWVIILWIQQGRVLKLWHRFPQASETREGEESGAHTHTHTHTHTKTKVTHEPRHKWETCGSERQICNRSLSGTNRHGAFHSRSTALLFIRVHCTPLKPCYMSHRHICWLRYRLYITGVKYEAQGLELAGPRLQFGPLDS